MSELNCEHNIGLQKNKEEMILLTLCLLQQLIKE